MDSCRRGFWQSLGLEFLEFSSKERRRYLDVGHARKQTAYFSRMLVAQDCDPMNWRYVCIKGRDMGSRYSDDDEEAEVQT